MVAVVTGRHLGHEISVGKKITRHLLEDETVERHVVVEGPDYPVPPDPHVTDAVVLVSVGIGITGGIQPKRCHLFSIVWRRKQTIHHLLISIGGLIVHEIIDLLGRRR